MRLIYKPVIFSLYLFVLASDLLAQNALPLFDNKENTKLVQECVDHIYNMEFAKAREAFEPVRMKLDGHPAIDMIEAFFISWQEMPFNSNSPGYHRHIEKLEAVIKKAEVMLEKDPENQEGIFFEMSARGLLAEYYADEDSYMKAVGEAKQTYDLIKKGFELTKENPEFLFTVGLYNYFREKYPERHPVYKPFLWFFKSGNKEVGLKQLDMACKQGVLTKVEAHLYTSYIYLRYENDPETALRYLRKLQRDYPKNSFFQTKLAEALVMNEKYKDAMPLALELSESPDPYYRMSANLFFGMIKEKRDKNLPEAADYYRKGLQEATNFEHKGQYYKSLMHLGLGRIHATEGKKDLAREEFTLALEWATTEEVEEEAKGHLKKL